MNIAILTARGGSKRIPRKNIRPFLGKPMISWPIECLLKSGSFNHVLVSTEDQEIAECSRAYGAEVPYLRPVELADDLTHAHVPAQHMLKWAMEQWSNIKFVAHVYPTSPLLKKCDIEQGFQLLNSGYQFVFTAQKLNFPVYQMVIKNSNGCLEPLFEPELANLRSQDMPDAFIDAGQLYIYSSPQAFLNRDTISTMDMGIIPLPPERAIDIDCEDDWLQAETIAKSQLIL